MYREFYHLKRKPFVKTPDPGMLYLGPAYAEALARMEQAVEDRELMLLTGEIGSGKTTLSRTLIDRLGENYRVALIINPRLTPNQLLRTVAVRLGAEPPKYFRSDLVDQVNGLLYDCYDKGICPVLILDEAQLIPGRDTFEEIRLLTNFQLDEINLLAMILIGQPDLLRRLEHPTYEAFRQRIGLRYHLGALDRAGTEAYLRYRLEQAGGKQGLFSREATELIWRLSRGIPRRINNLAGSALLEGFGREAKVITPEIIANVAQDLGMALADDEIEPENPEPMPEWPRKKKNEAAPAVAWAK
jgi:type II secretory pathway predicted ATPase ExeA